MKKRINIRNLVSVMAAAIILFGYGVSAASAQTDAMVLRRENILSGGL
jgi:hypothetical protein